jgi:hypothetical protein
MDEFEYSNGACGSCQECGDPTEEEHHVFCSDCWAGHNGWRRPSREALAWQHEDREEVSRLRLLDRVGELERRVATLIDLVASHEQRIAALELEGSLSDRRAA